MAQQLRGDDLAYATLDYIREHPEEWDQGSYACRTTACFAGWAVMLGENLAAQDLYRPRYRVPGPRGGMHTRARRLLGWTEAQADHVFFCFTADVTELELAVKNVLNGVMT